MYKATVAVCSEIRTEHINILCGQNLELLNVNPFVLELDIYSLEHHLCKIRIFYEPRSVTLGNTRHFVEE